MRARRASCELARRAGASAEQLGELGRSAARSSGRPRPGARERARSSWASWGRRAARSSGRPRAGSRERARSSWASWGRSAARSSGRPRPGARERARSSWASWGRSAASLSGRPRPGARERARSSSTSARSAASIEAQTEGAKNDHMRHMVIFSRPRPKLRILPTTYTGQRSGAWRRSIATRRGREL